MGTKEIKQQKAVAAQIRKGETVMNKGVPPPNLTPAQMESYRTGEYEQMAKQGAAHLRIFKNV